MQKFFLLLLLFFIPSNSLFIKGTGMINDDAPVTDAYELYHAFELSDKVNYKAFKQAIVGYSCIEGRKKDILTLIDYSLPSTEKRLYVLDMKNRKLLFVSHVSHGRNSGGNYATDFSNKCGSYKSSLGFFLTENTYQGRNGYSLILNGLEKDINDKARERAIVIHGAPYANPTVIPSSGRLGRSLGCPALPEAVSKTIIDTIKGGSLLYIYADDATYLAQSTILPEPVQTNQKI